MKMVLKFGIRNVGKGIVQVLGWGFDGAYVVCLRSIIFQHFVCAAVYLCSTVPPFLQWTADIMEAMKLLQQSSFHALWPLISKPLEGAT